MDKGKYLMLKDGKNNKVNLLTITDKIVIGTRNEKKFLIGEIEDNNIHLIESTNGEPLEFAGTIDIENKTIKGICFLSDNLVVKGKILSFIENEKIDDSNKEIIEEIKKIYIDTNDEFKEETKELYEKVLRKVF